jgi:hypothetical protein
MCTSQNQHQNYFLTFQYKAQPTGEEVGWVGGGLGGGGETNDCGEVNHCDIEN